MNDKYSPFTEIESENEKNFTDHQIMETIDRLKLALEDLDFSYECLKCESKLKANFEFEYLCKDNIEAQIVTFSLKCENCDIEPIVLSIDPDYI